jgi:GntR family transcriptional regulator
MPRPERFTTVPAPTVTPAARSRPTPKFVAGSTTLYAQMASVLRSRIVSGEWPHDFEIPSIDELCAQYGLGRITVRQALQILASEGMVSSQRGRRTIVTFAPGDQEAAQTFASMGAVESESPDYSIQVISRTRVAELPATYWAVGSSRGPYMFLRKTDRSGDQPYALSNIYVAEDIYKRFPKGAETSSKLARLVIKFSKSPISVARERLRVAAADYEEADALGCDMATPVARVERAFCDATGRVLYYGNTTYRGDRYGVERDLIGHVEGIKSARYSLRDVLPE